MALNGVLFLASEAGAQNSIGDSINQKLGIYVFPAKDQTPQQQATDENACYQWAIGQTGVDPLNPPEVAAQQVDQGAAAGSGARGATRGAARGAAIGAIAGDTGKGAAWGAAGGMVRGRRSSRRGHAVEQDMANAGAQQQEAGMLDSFIRAYSACLEGKGYTVN